MRRELSVDDVRGVVADLAESVEAGEMAVKTVNNTLVTPVVFAMPVRVAKRSNGRCRG